MKEALKEAVLRALAAVGIEAVEAVIERPADIAHGDYATNAALRYAKQAGIPSRVLAGRLVGALGAIDGVEKVEIADPGFINFTLASRRVAAMLANACAEGWGKNTANAGERILFEHSSPNLFKPFHIGHLVNNAIGESLVRLLRNSGAAVMAISYPSDISPGIAKAVWHLAKTASKEDESIEAVGLGAAYAAGVQAYDADPAAKAEIDEVTRQLYTKQPGTYWTIYERGKRQSLDYFKTQTARLGSVFDGGFIFESESETRGVEIVKQHVPDVFTLSDGAYVFFGSKYGLFDNVFVNSAGFATYLGKDIGLLDLKFSRFEFDRSITITDIEQKPHFQLVQKAAEHINPAWTKQSVFLQHGRLQFIGGKISSRYGNVPLLEDLVAAVREKARDRAVEAGRVAQEDLHQTLEDIALAALKYSILRTSPGVNITFDFEAATSVEGDSGPYLQYTHARCVSLLEKGDKAGVEAALDEAYALPDLARHLLHFPEVCERAAREYEPHHVATFLAELAAAFNAWYAAEQILDGTHAAAHKLAVVQAVERTLKNGLWLLGIPAPERM